MNRKTIFGITALLAVIAMCLTFTACPPDNEERSVTFINQTKIQIRIEGNFSLVTLPPSRWDAATFSYIDSEKTVTKTGDDIVIEHITFDNGDVQLSPTTYLTMTGSATAGKEVKDGVSLKSGILYFTPIDGLAGNPAAFNKISTIQLDE